jgi:hypothetical protein
VAGLDRLVSAIKFFTHSTQLTLVVFRRYGRGRRKDNIASFEESVTEQNRPESFPQIGLSAILESDDFVARS